LNLPALAIALAVLTFGIKYLVIDLLQSETECMTQLRRPLLEARAKVESTEYREQLVGLYLEISAQEDARIAEGALDRTSTAQRTSVLSVVLSGADYTERIQKLSVAAQLVAQLDSQFKRVRSAGRFGWIWGLMAVVLTIAWATAANIPQAADAAEWFGIAAGIFLARSCYARLRYELDKRELGRLVNEHS
jgi:hypothetical protein